MPVHGRYDVVGTIIIDRYYMDYHKVSVSAVFSCSGLIRVKIALFGPLYM